MVSFFYYLSHNDRKIGMKEEIYKFSRIYNPKQDILFIPNPIPFEGKLTMEVDNE